ncbi:hypothetical protein DSM112329_02832 [Paraconexibacter sp. AEG42_29]|uniref:FCP1 homology domain-containing protein n=1 Tax=Paraconexibacter sp. AEG42_29 TaxID=2997339 RepID=A0AAU7AW69_9ACTN
MRLRRPDLLLDVDGVLLPLGDRGDVPLVRVPGHEHLRYRAETPARLRRLSEVFRLVWATTWEEEANEVLAPLFGLPPLPVIMFGNEASLGDSWKLPAIRRFVVDRPFAYVDDDIGDVAAVWAEHRPQPTLLLPIPGDRGLGAGDEGRLLTFASAATEQR